MARQATASGAARRASPPKVSPPKQAAPQAPPAPAADSTHRFELDGAVRSVTVGPTEGAAELAHRIAGARLASTDLTGRITAWRRLAHGGVVQASNAKVAALDGAVPFTLVVVPNRELLLEVSVDTKPTTRVRTPVGTAIPVRYLLDHLRAWLRLPEGDWVLEVDGRVVHRLQVLAELNVTEETTLVVRR
jgi:hypothetical protein